MTENNRLTDVEPVIDRYCPNDGEQLRQSKAEGHATCPLCWAEWPIKATSSREEYDRNVREKLYPKLDEYDRQQAKLRQPTDAPREQNGERGQVPDLREAIIDAMNEHLEAEYIGGFIAGREDAADAILALISTPAPSSIAEQGAVCCHPDLGGTPLDSSDRRCVLDDDRRQDCDIAEFEGYPAKADCPYWKVPEPANTAPAQAEPRLCPECKGPLTEHGSGQGASCDNGCQMAFRESDLIAAAAKAALAKWNALPPEQRNEDRPYIIGFSDGWEEAEQAQAEQNAALVEALQTVREQLLEGCPTTTILKTIDDAALATIRKDEQ